MNEALRHSGGDEGGKSGTLSKALAWFDVLEQTLRTMADSVSCHPRQKQGHDGPGSRQASLHSLKSGLKIGREDWEYWGEVRSRAMILRFSQPRFWFKYKCQSLNITCTHYPDSLFFDISFSRCILKGKEELSLERHVTYIRSK